jgi:hypothetical protein
MLNNNNFGAGWDQGEKGKGIPEGGVGVIGDNNLSPGEMRRGRIKVKNQS